MTQLNMRSYKRKINQAFEPYALIRPSYFFKYFLTLLNNSSTSWLLREFGMGKAGIHSRFRSELVGIAWSDLDSHC